MFKMLGLGKDINLVVNTLGPTISRGYNMPEMMHDCAMKLLWLHKYQSYKLENYEVVLECLTSIKSQINQSGDLVTLIKQH
jgi:hypothetical protein